MTLADTVTLLQPPKIVFGAGCASKCAVDLTERKFRHIAVVGNERTLTQVSQLLSDLRSGGTCVSEVSGIPAEPTTADLLAAKARLDRSGPTIDAVVGIGGGSVLDVAKLLAALPDGAGHVGRFFGSGLLPPRRTYLACLPTTAGSGSEVSPNAILMDETAGSKKGVISPHLVPDAAYVDPLLTVSMPPALTAATGMDALVHCIEAFANKKAHPAVDTYALRGIRLISQNLATAVQSGNDIAARSAVALGSLYGGLCLGPVNTAAVHALAYPLGSAFRMAHGLANSLMLNSVLRFNLPAAPDRYAAIANELGTTVSGAGMEERAMQGLQFLASLRRQCGLPSGLAECGISREDIPALVSGGMQVTRLLQNNVREVTAKDAENIFSDAF